MVRLQNSVKQNRTYKIVSLKQDSHFPHLLFEGIEQNVFYQNDAEYTITGLGLFQLNLTESWLNYWKDGAVTVT